MSFDLDTDDPTLWNIAEAIVSIEWKERRNGYEKLADLLQNQPPTWVTWDKLAQIIPKIAAEQNIPALEKGLDAVSVYVERCGKIDDQVVRDTLNALAKSSLPNRKSTVESQAVKIFTSFINKGKQDIVLGMVLQKIEPENIKKSVAFVKVLTKALEMFGPSRVAIPLVLQKLLEISSHRALFQQVAVKELLKELYSHVGTGMNELLDRLDSHQRKALLLDFAAAPDKRANPGPSSVQPKVLSTQGKQSKVNSKSHVTTIAQKSMVLDIPVISKDTSRETSKPMIRPRSPTGRGGRSSESSAGKFSTRDSSPSARVKSVTKLDELFSMLQNDQWALRKNALSELLPLIESSREVSERDYNLIIGKLKELIQRDSNVVLVASALKCVTAFARKCEPKFKKSVPAMMAMLFEKFKEKKSIVVEALREAVDTIYLTNPYGNISKYVEQSLDSPSPTVKSETAMFVCRCFSKPTPSLLMDMKWKQLTTILVQNLKFPDPKVRNDIMKALGTIMKVLGEDEVASMFDDIQKGQLHSIYKYWEEAEIAFQPHNGITEVDPDPSSSSRKSTLGGVRTNSSVTDGQSKLSSKSRVKGSQKPNSANTHGSWESEYLTGEEPDDVVRVSKATWASKTNKENQKMYNKPNYRRSESPQARRKETGVQEDVQGTERTIKPNLFRAPSPSSLIEDYDRRLGPDSYSIYFDGYRAGQSEMYSSTKYDVTEEINYRLEHLKINIMDCAAVIGRLLPALHEKMQGSSSVENQMVLHRFNDKVGEMELFLKTMTFKDQSKSRF